MSEIYSSIDKLLRYGTDNELILDEDIVYTRNKILELLDIDDYKESKLDDKEENIDQLLEKILKFAISKGLILDSISEKDNFDSRIMGTLIARPSEIMREFKHRYSKKPQIATDFFYELSKKSNYIRTERVKKDLKWKVDTEYGVLDITINMSKPEKDIVEIERQAKAKKGEYPKCLLCRECEGYSGRINYPSRSNHRLIGLDINNSKWFLQYSPYVYFNEHSIILSQEHTPIRINRNTFIELTEFVDKFKHYFIGSNSELPIVGGSILAHNHYQGGRYEFPIEKAEVLEVYKTNKFKDLEIKRLNWPLSTIRIISENKDNIIDFSEHILNCWRAYSDLENDIVSKTNQGNHNTITPICRFKDGKYEMDLVLRNNRKSEQYPTGIFHPHKEYHHIKKENIGLIEVMGLAVLPARLNNIMDDMKNYILFKKYKDSLEEHKIWLDKILNKYSEINEMNVLEVLKCEIGIVFKSLLENCAVFKKNVKGINGFNKFIQSCFE